MKKGVGKLTASEATKKIPKWGWVCIATTHKGISRIDLLQSVPTKCPTPSGENRKIFREIENYLNGKSKTLRLKVDIQKGTPFQKQVWKSLQKIPFGEVQSYAWLAKKLKRPKAFRAVGQACGANPLPLVFPCHRVIASSGKIGGFSCGLAYKRRLLRLEKTDRIKP